MSNFGSDYAAAYDAMYEEKDYVGECDQLQWGFKEFGTIPTNSVLDLGCGTGKHSWELAKRGYQVTGVDQSADMLAVAKNQKLGQASGTKPTFTQGDAINFDLKQEFDAVVMMFAVISYLSTNDALILGLKNISRHLKPGGLFMADFWYGPGVLMDNPTQRSHVRTIGETRVKRKVTPKLNLVENTCLLNYEVTTTDEKEASHTVFEEHTMRYFFGPELRLMLSLVGMELLHLGKSSDWRMKLTGADWTGSLMARRV